MVATRNRASKSLAKKCPALEFIVWRRTMDAKVRYVFTGVNKRLSLVDLWGLQQRSQAKFFVFLIKLWSPVCRHGVAVKILKGSIFAEIPRNSSIQIFTSASLHFCIYYNFVLLVVGEGVIPVYCANFSLIEYLDFHVMKHKYGDL